MELALILILILIMALLFFLLRNRFSDQLLTRFENNIIHRMLQKYSVLLVLLFSFLIVLGLFGRTLAAEWNVIDDHEIMFFLGPDGKLPPGEVFETLSLTEVGNFGLQERFRPSYYFLRIVECAFCGANPTYWHAARLVFLWLGMSLVWILIAPRLGWLGGGIFCAYILTFPYWVDIIGKLGAGESYAVFGLPLYLWGIASAFQKDATQTKYILACLFIFLGSVICIGSKENFLLLIIPSTFVAWKAFKTRKHFLFLSALGSVAFAFFVAGAVVFLIFRSGTDVYSNSISPLARLDTLLNSMFSEHNFLSIAILFSLTVALGVVLLIRGISTEIRKTVLQTMLWLLILLAIYVSQLIFYNGVWPIGNRYDFPGMLYIPATIYLLYNLADNIPSGGINIKLPRYIVRTIFIGALFLAVLTKGYTRTTLMLEEIVKTTKEFTSRLSEMSATLKEKQDYALVIDSVSVWDYEAIFSYERFLRATGVENPIFLRIHCYSPETSAEGLENSLALHLAEISAQGNNIFLPVSRLSDYENRCFSLDMSNSTFVECSTSESVFAVAKCPFEE